VAAAIRGRDDGLPLFLVDGKIVAQGSYPSREVLAELVGLVAPRSIYSEAVLALVALGAAIAANCEPCFRYHFDKARKLGVSKDDMARAVTTAQMVKDSPARAMIDLAEKYLGAKVATKEGPDACRPSPEPDGAGQGQPAQGRGEPGDMFVRIRIQPHPLFRVEGSDIHLDLPVAPWEAVLGAEVEVPTLEKTVTMKLPPGTQNGRQLRLRGRGMKGEGAQGDEIVHVRIVIPTEVSDREKQLFRQLRDISHFRPRVRERTSQ
jgi:AhpD family alkylhydroperoxidase